MPDLSQFRVEFSQLFPTASAGRIALCRAVRAVRRHPRSAAHVHDFFELSFVQAGHYDLMQPGRSAVRLKAAEMFLLPPRQLHYERYTRDVRPRVGWIGFSLPGDSRLALAIAEQAGRRLAQPATADNLEQLAAEILFEQSSRLAGWEEKLTAALARLLVIILRAAPRRSLNSTAKTAAAARAESADSSPAGKPAVPPHAAELVDAAAHYLEEHCAEDVSIGAVAASFGSSHAHFSSLFRRRLGVSPRRFLIAARLNRARRLLAAGKLTHAAIAQDCGFYDEAHFSRAFRELTGVPPSRYQRTPDDIRAAL